MGQSYIGHLDADCFYVSAERVRNVFLLGKPVGVLGNQGACVIAKSYEMKTAGVRTGMPIWDALRLCPEAVFVKRDFRWYEVLSRRMLEVVTRFSPRVEYYSIDEFFFAVPPTPPADLQALAATIRDRVRVEVGVPVTVGIARTKTLARLVAEGVKPCGAAAVAGEGAERAVLAGRPVTDVGGIAGRRGLRLALQGITTCLQLVALDRRRVRKLLTRMGEILWYELRGEPAQPLYARRPPHRMLSRGGSLGRATADPNVLYAWLVRNLERLIEELDYHGVHAGRLAVWLGYRDGRSGAGEIPLVPPAGHFDALLDAGRRGLRRAWVRGATATRMQLTATELRWRDSVQRGLFELPSARADALARVKREVNARCGRFALRSGATLYLSELYRDDASDYDIGDVRGKMCF